MRISINTLIWKRHPIFELWAKSMQSIITAFPNIEIVVNVAGSEGNLSKNLVEKYNFNYVECENILGKKFNAVFQLSQLSNPNYVLLLGSDSIINKSLFQTYLSESNGKDYLGVVDLYYYDVCHKKAKYWPGYKGLREGEPIGAGRLFSKKLLDTLNWTPYSDHIMKGCDADMSRRLKNIGFYNPHLIYLKGTNNLLLEIRSSVNLTELSHNWNTFTNVEIDKILKLLGK